MPLIFAIMSSKAADSELLPPAFFDRKASVLPIVHRPGKTLPVVFSGNDPNVNPW